MLLQGEAETAEMTEQDKWHFDRTINISVMIGFLATAGSGIWFAAIQTARTDQLEKDRAADRARIDTIEHDRALQGDRLIRLETKVDNVDKTLSEVKGLLTPPPIPLRR